MKHLIRTASIALLVTTGLAACSSKEEAAAVVIAPVTASAAVKPFTIGVFQAAAVSDGELTVANDGKTIAINAKKADIDAALTANNLPTDAVHLSVQPLLVKTANKVLLFDTGAAGLFGPTLGKFSANLTAAGVHPASVTDIFISHGHGDHIGGLVANDALVFPNAAIHIQAAEWASLRSQVETAALVTLIEPKVVEFQPGADLLPGVKAVDIKGHTPGHSGYLITSGKESLLYIGDTMHHSVISVQQPDWTIAFDGDAPVAQASRKQLINSSVSSGQRIYAVHFPFPGLGKIVMRGDTYVWAAE